MFFNYNYIALCHMMYINTMLTTRRVSEKRPIKVKRLYTDDKSTEIGESK